MNLAIWENIFEKKISDIATAEDPAHDLLHFKRVVYIAKKLCDIEKANETIVVPAAWLHDLVIVPKNDPRRSQASRLSAKAAATFLKSVEYPEEHLHEIAHAIEAHSFSAQIEPKTIEAKIIQDADRLDGLGAIGIARCFAVAGSLKRPLYSAIDPFCEEREPDDSQFTVDHFYTKLFNIAETLQTAAGREEGIVRASVMKSYLQTLAEEIILDQY